MTNIYKILEEEKAKGNQCALCIIVSTQGSTPLKTGAKMLVTQSGEIFGTIGGGNLEKRVIENAKEAIIKNESKLFEHNLLQQHAMCCGGTVKVYIEPFMPIDKLYVFGAGHVGRALSKFASSLNFDVFVIDDRAEEINQIMDSSINKMPLRYDKIISSLPFDLSSYIAIMTYDHQIDREILAYCLKKQYAYLGMIGSKRKVEITRKMFLSTQMFTEEEISKVDMPMGFDLKANNPEEIAISILAKIIEIKNNRTLSIKNKKNISESNRIEA